MKNCNIEIFSNDEVKIRRFMLMYKEYSCLEDIRTLETEYKKEFIRYRGWTNIPAKYSCTIKVPIELRDKLVKDCGLINIGVNHKHDWFFEEEFI